VAMNEKKKQDLLIFYRNKLELCREAHKGSIVCTVLFFHNPYIPSWQGMALLLLWTKQLHEHSALYLYWVIFQLSEVWKQFMGLNYYIKVKHMKQVTYIIEHFLNKLSGTSIKSHNFLKHFLVGDHYVIS
jgi:hypothetical protein